MTLASIDIALLAVLVYFMLSGLYHGFIQTAGALIGLIAGLFIGAYGVLWLDESFQVLTRPLMAISIFLLIAMIVSRLVGWIAHVLDGIWKVLSIIPFLAGINKLLGGIVGAFEGVLILAAVSYFAAAHLPEGDVRGALEASEVLPWLDILSNWLGYILPHTPV